MWFSKRVTRTIAIASVLALVYINLDNSRKAYAQQNASFLLELWGNQNTQCQAGPGDKAGTQAACDARNATSIRLQQFGWCYEREGKSDPKLGWRLCTEGSPTSSATAVGPLRLQGSQSGASAPSAAVASERPTPLTVEPTDARVQVETKRQAQPVREWLEGGTLHNVSAAAWLDARSEDRLATSADWVIAMRGRAWARANWGSLRVNAQALTNCVTEASATKPTAPVPTGTLAASCGILLGF